MFSVSFHSSMISGAGMNTEQTDTHVSIETTDINPRTQHFTYNELHACIKKNPAITTASLTGSNCLTVKTREMS